MRAVSVFDAKTKFSSLVNYVVTKKEEVTITKHGHEVAKLIPINAQQSKTDRHKVIEDIENLSSEIGETGIGVKDIQEMRAQGRR